MSISNVIKGTVKFVNLDCKGLTGWFTINNLSWYNSSIEKEVEKNMEEKKNNKGLVWLIVILIILVLGLVGYIVYDKVILNTSEVKYVYKNKIKKQTRS